MRLLPRESLIKTGPFDEARWNYRFLVGIIIRQRYRLLERLLQGQRGRRLLEIGYGSGIYLPELARVCDELHGIDVHAMHEEVTRILAEQQIAAQRIRGIPALR